MMLRLARPSLAILSLLLASPALASDPAAKPSATAKPSSTAKAAEADPAQALFDAGVADMESGRFEKACPAIEASQRLDPRPGTLFTLAECEAQRGRVATAMRYYAEYLALYRTFTQQRKLEQKARASASEAQMKSLDLLAPRLTLVVAEPAGTEVIVKRDGEVVADLSLGVALAVDPGEHIVTIEAPGGPPREYRVSLSPGESKTLRLRSHVDAPAPAVTAVASAVPSSSARAVAAIEATRRTMVIGALASGAVGIAGLAVGVVTGVLAIEEQSSVRRHCPKDVCDDSGFASLARLDTLTIMNTTGFVAGGLGIGVSVVLLVAAPSAPTSSPAVGPPRTTGVHLQTLGLSVGGSF